MVRPYEFAACWHIIGKDCGSRPAGQPGRRGSRGSGRRPAYPPYTDHFRAFGRELPCAFSGRPLCRHYESAPITAFRTIAMIGEKIGDREGTWGDKPGGVAGQRGNIFASLPERYFLSRGARARSLTFGVNVGRYPRLPVPATGRPRGPVGQAVAGDRANVGEASRCTLPNQAAG
jgi:hypothetical protein